MKTDKMTFVFGSNESGIHGAGAAKYAMQERGMPYGKSYGHYGECFAIPTKDERIETLDPLTIQAYIFGFVAFARGRPKLSFQVTQIGCGLAGLKKEDVAPWFSEAIRVFSAGPIKNLYFDEGWKPFMVEGTKYWGTHG